MFWPHQWLNLSKKQFIKEEIKFLYMQEEHETRKLAATLNTDCRVGHRVIPFML
jgi:hypothetical protein